MLLLLLACGVLIALATSLFLPSREPCYAGIALHDWIEILQHPGWTPNPRGASRSVTANEALSHIGTNALPFLLRWMSCEAQPSKRGALVCWFVTRTRLKHTPKILDDWVLRDEWHARFLAERAEAAAGAFQVLGPAAKCAIPELTRLARDRGWHSAANRAVRALGFIGPTAIPALFTVVENTPKEIRGLYEVLQLRGIGDVVLSRSNDVAEPVDLRDYNAVITIGRFGTNALFAVPQLLRYLQEDTAAAAAAAEALGMLKADPRLIVPALTVAAQQGTTAVRVSAIAALEQFGRDALSAVPALLDASSDPDALVRDAAMQALSQVAGETAAR